jgi:predicted NAD/FAD-binding protein
MTEPKRGPERSSVAVVGTGMAGLSAAHLLKNDPQGRFDVEVFEAVCPALLSFCLLLDVSWTCL